jgi:hypothetical protein
MNQDDEMRVCMELEEAMKNGSKQLFDMFETELQRKEFCLNTYLATIGATKQILQTFQNTLARHPNVDLARGIAKTQKLHEVAKAQYKTALAEYLEYKKTHSV